MRKNKKAENYLDKKPMRREGISWSEKDGSVTLEIENKGVFNRIAQKLLKKPKISYIHLDEMGSFIWPIIDGEKTVFELGGAVEERFGDDAKPLYERLVKYFQILESYNFISFNENK